MANAERQQTVLHILQNLRDLDGLKRLFWEELNYERENRPLSPRKWPENARQPLAEDPILFAAGGENNAFRVIYCRLASDTLSRGDERPIVNRLTREHPYALFVFSNNNRSEWHFLNVKYDEEAEKRRLLRRIVVRPGEGLRTAAERVQMLDLESIGPDIFELSPLTIQQRHDNAFDVEKVTKDFYREIASWYFWALKHPNVIFPRDVKSEQDQSIFFIRLLTRLIFCWFTREKGLIPQDLFDQRAISALLKDTREESGTYYRAILQNLFFATLNQEEIEKRRFRKKNEGGRDGNRGATNLYRYANLLADQDTLLKLFHEVPFINGGLFDCLDEVYRKSEDREDMRMDDFSEERANRLCIPNQLFFGAPQTVDLSTMYGDKKHSKEIVRGLIRILSHYQFTVEENTPFDQSVALDPELLGKVFENLLAAYNPETGTTARKATGSFYTPREIVDYMVDESLMAYLKGKLEGDTGIPACENQGDIGIPACDSHSTSITITRRNLPHWTRDGSIYWVTFRLADSLPQDKLRAWTEERDIWKKAHPKPWSELEWEEYEERFGKLLDEWLDAGYGSCILTRTDVRNAVRASLMKFNGERLRVHAAVLMPTHVHALLEPLGGNTLSKLLRGIKGTGAREANKLLGTSGKFWMDESYDHIVRSEIQYKRFLQYIEANPRKANLKEGEYWLHKKSDTGVSACESQGGTGIPACDSSAQTKMSVSPSIEERLRALLAYDEAVPQFSEADTETLIDAIDNLKALDPAVGSGAFPMGILHKLVHVLGKLDPNNERWKAKQIAKLDDAAMREDAERLFRENYDDFGRKLYLIQNCIYGVDIQPIAVQIAKMRFFISLIVDQRVEGGTGIPACDPSTQTRMSVLPNRGVRALPNLETKFVAANTLVGIEKPKQMMLRNPEIDKKEKELRKIREKHFTAKTLQSKARCREDDKRLRGEIAKLLKNDGWNDTTAKQLAAWDPYDQNASSPFFDPEWMFGVREGFDVVIGNPPYGTEMPAELTRKLDTKFSAFKSRTRNSAIYFIYTADELLKAKGCNAFVVPKSLCYSAGWRSCAKFVAKELSRLIDIGKAFENVLLEQVVFLRNKQMPVPCFINGLYKDGQILEMAEVDKIIFDRSKVLLAGQTRKEIELIIRINNSCQQTLGEFVSFKRGLNWQGKAVHHRGKTPIYRGAQLDKWLLHKATDFVDLNTFDPKEYKYQLQPKILNQLAIAHVQNPYPHFYLQAALDKDGAIVVFETISCMFAKKPNINLKFILGLNNSILFAWLLYKFVYSNAIRSTRYDGEYVGRIPMPNVQIADQAPIVALVDKMLLAKRPADTSDLERQIDRQVYKLYGLTAEEIKIVEGAT